VTRATKCVALGHHKKGSGGIRVIGEDHLIINNYIDAVEKGGFWVTAGVPNSALNAYFQAPNCVIVFNTFVDFRIARSVLAESGFSEEEHFDVLHVLTAQGGYCDCEILSTPHPRVGCGHSIGVREHSSMTKDQRPKSLEPPRA
jgi:hypothetical protein